MRYREIFDPHPGNQINHGRGHPVGLRNSIKRLHRVVARPGTRDATAGCCGRRLDVAGEDAQLTTPALDALRARQGARHWMPPIRSPRVDPRPTSVSSKSVHQPIAMRAGQ
jgi:hypothetical protein